MEEIIYRECTGQELSVAEQRKLRIWLSESPKNRYLYNQLKLALKYPGVARSNEIRREVWNDVQAKIKTHKQYKKHAPSYYKQWMKIAAVLVISLGFGILLYSVTIHSYFDPAIREVKWTDKVSLKGQKVSTMLPDGTRVKLNAGSKLLVPTEFAGNIREVTLTGEAYFDVARDTLRPFVINTNTISIQVLGTSFNVKSYPEEDSAVVAVASGKVAVSDINKKKDSIHLIAGEKVAYSKEDGRMVHEKSFDWEKELGWKDNILIFTSADLSNITKTLTNWYGVEFKILNHSINNNKRFTGRYEDPSLKLVLEGVSFVYGFNYEIEENIVIIK